MSAPEKAGRKARPRRTSSRVLSTTLKYLCSASAFLISGILLAVIGYFVSIGGSAINWQLFSELPQARGMEGYPGGMLNAILGTCVLLVLASVVGIPVGILTGIFLSEYGSESRIAAPARFVCDVLAGVPSIVVGILGYELLVVPIGHYNGYAGAFALAIVMIPIVARSTEEMLRLVPNTIREASIALGATRAHTIMKVVLPAATGGVVTGVMLAMARVASETAPLLFTALGSRLLTLDPSQPLPSLTVHIFNQATGPYREEQTQAWAGMLILILLVFVLNLAVRFSLRKSTLKLG
ncbi:MAG: phosphate ABC transporter permease PstA [Planctomycetes bacterium]|nr:phosphate ABC transporter permease PstA [Planctomycetota bacterium]